MFDYLVKVPREPETQKGECILISLAEGLLRNFQVELWYGPDS